MSFNPFVDQVHFSTSLDDGFSVNPLVNSLIDRSFTSLASSCFRANISSMGNDSSDPLVDHCAHSFDCSLPTLSSLCISSGELINSVVRCILDSSLNCFVRTVAESFANTFVECGRS